MSNELPHIESDLEALTWAAGCVVAGYVERSRVTDVIHTWFARVLLTLLIGREVLSMLFAPVLTAAYRMHYLRLAGFLGAFTPGDDYHRFIPLMDSTPMWMHAVWVTAGALFVVSAYYLLRDRRAAFPIFAAAGVLGAAGDLSSRAIPAYTTAFSFPEPMFTRDYLVPAASALLPVLIALALWTHARRCFAAGAPTGITEGR